MAQCTAKSKRTKERCQRPACIGKTVCYHHGGWTPVGLTHPSAKHGRRSKHLPTRLRANYEAALDDPRINALDDEIALVDARISELLSDLSGGTGDKNHWALLSEAWKAWENARRMPVEDPRRGVLMTEHLASVGTLIRSGKSEHATWREIGTQVDRKAKLLESRNRLAGAYTAEQVLLMLGAVAEIVMRHVDDRDVRARIGREVEATIDISGRLLPEPA